MNSNNYTALVIWLVLGMALFGYLWWSGALRWLSNYVILTREEMKKCTWPTSNELFGATVVVLVTTVILGVFTVGIDFLVSLVVKVIT